jgi:lipoprotein-anchoring transpeptidase ErfK/SrfK
LARLLTRKAIRDGIQLSEAITGDGAAIFRHACAMGLEGIVSKRIGSRYASAAHAVKRTTRISREVYSVRPNLPNEGTMRVSMGLGFIASIAAGFLCGDLIAAAQTYSPNSYGLQANPAYGGGFGTEYYLRGTPRGTVGSRRPSAMPSDADPDYSSAQGFDDEVALSQTTRRTVIDPTGQGSGTITINTAQRKLYLSLGGGRAIEYGIGVGRQGFAWKGEAHVGRKAFWPGWTPPKEMIARRPDLPDHMEGGMENPLGARALYLFKGGKDTLFRIHGTNEPGTIGRAVSSGCIRMLNADVIDLYQRVAKGTPVVVL